LQVSTCDLKDVVNKLIPDSIGKDIEKSCSFFYPLQDVYIRKVKILKKPKFEMGKLLEMHGEGAGNVGPITTASGEKIETRPDAYEPPVQESV
jgi:small subunit ribosomal protein S3Ae